MIGHVIGHVSSLCGGGGKSVTPWGLGEVCVGPCGGEGKSVWDPVGVRGSLCGTLWG